MALAVEAALEISAIAFEALRRGQYKALYSQTSHVSAIADYSLRRCMFYSTWYILIHIPSPEPCHHA